MTGLIVSLRSNPVVKKELRSRMRGSRAFWVLTAYLALLSAGIGLIFLVFSVAENAGAGSGLRQALGRTVFGAVIGLELLTVTFIAPALTAGAISAERERLTYDLLRTTLLSARSLVFGKLLAALAYMFLLLFTALPMQSLAYLLGGLTRVEILIANLLLIVTAGSFSSAGLFFSSITRRTLVSTVLSYAFAILLVFGLPVLFVAGIGLFNAFFFNAGAAANLVSQTLLVLVGWFLVSINPAAAAVASELILLEQQSLIYFRLPLVNGNTLRILSPWISFLALHLLSSAILFCASVRFARRVDR